MSSNSVKEFKTTCKEIINHTNSEFLYPILSEILYNYGFQVDDIFGLLEESIPDDDGKHELNEALQNLKRTNKTLDNLILELNENSIDSKYKNKIISFFQEINNSKSETKNGDGDIIIRIEGRLNGGLTPKALLAQYLKETYDLIKDINTLEIFKPRREGGYEKCTDIFLHQLLDHEFPYKISLNHIKDITAFLADYQEPETEIVQFNNCYLDLRTHKTILISDKNIYCNRRIDYDYNPEAESSILEKSLRDTLQKDFQIFLKYIGYCFYSHHEESKIGFLIGDPGSGKSTISQILSRLFGKENISHCELQDIVGDRFSTAEMMGKTLNIIDDTSTRGLSDLAKINSIISGSAVNADKKYGDKFTIEGYQIPKLLVNGNSLPKIDDKKQSAFYDRIILMHTNKIYRSTDEEIKGFADILPTEEIEWLIYNGLWTFKNTEWTSCKEEIKEAYLMESNPYEYQFNKFYEVTFDDTDYLSPGDIYSTLKKTIVNMRQKGIIITVPDFSLRDLDKLCNNYGIDKKRKWVIKEYEDDKGIMVTDKKQDTVYTGVTQRDCIIE